MKKLRFSSINWANTLFLILVPVAAVVGTTLLAVNGAIHWQTIILALVFSIFSGLAVTAGYHRMFAHKSYQAAWPIRLFYVLFASAAFEGSVLEWCTDHRNHHRYTDTEKDPYNIKQGFWHAHIGWLFTLDISKRDFDNVKDLQEDPIVRIQQRYYIPIAVFMGFILPALIAALWGDALSGLVIAGALRISFNHHLTFCINSVCHYLGKQTYSDRHTSRDHWISALLTFGEGFHNFHHQFPVDYRNGIRAYHYDPTKWLIRSLAWLGLVRDLKRVDAHIIIRYRLRMDKKRLMQHSGQHSESLLEHMGHLIKPLHDRILSALHRIEELEKAYIELQSSGINSVKGKMSEYSARIEEHRARIRAARQELKNALLIWTQIVRNNSKQLMVSES